ncbi:hypothetical protein D3C75_795690 [compost metagenome]
MLGQASATQHIAAQQGESGNLANHLFIAVEGIVGHRILGHAHDGDLLGLDHLPERDLHRGHHHVLHVVIRGGVEPAIEPVVGHQGGTKPQGQGNCNQGQRTGTHVCISLSKEVDLDEVAMPGPFQLLWRQRTITAHVTLAVERHVQQVARMAGHQRHAFDLVQCL